MFNKLTSFPVRLSIVLAIAAITLSGCNPAPANQTPGSTSKPLTTTTVDPNAPPAAYRLSNLTAQPMADDGPNVYVFYVDVENTGGQPGSYNVTYKLDNNAVEVEKTLKLDPGQKKPTRLIGPEIEILSMGQEYDNGTLKIREHTIYCGDLSLPILLALRPSLYVNTNSTVVGLTAGNITVFGEVKNTGGNNTIIGEVKSIDGNATFVEYFKNVTGNITLDGYVENSTGNITAVGKIVIAGGEVKNGENLTISGEIITIKGEVTNISDSAIENVIAVVDLRATNQQIIIPMNHAEAPVEMKTIGPGEKSPFKVVMFNNIPVNLTYYDYHITFKNASGEIIRTIGNMTQQ